MTLSSSGRTMAVRATVLNDFKTLVRQQGMSDDTIIIMQDKGTTQTHRLSHVVTLTHLYETLRQYFNQDTSS